MTTLLIWADMSNNTLSFYLIPDAPRWLPACNGFLIGDLRASGDIQHRLSAVEEFVGGAWKHHLIDDWKSVPVVQNHAIDQVVWCGVGA